MANQISNFISFFVILVLVASGWNISLQQVEGRPACSTPLGACGPAGYCARRCKDLHKEDGEGSCNFGLCVCIHGCP
ncbi:hypothetical protein MtrunA17_Chr5g0422651 [Medicago truncatula]|uniref:Defensin fusion n=1 Tax=Medicago truncatula TaxID=3880 RepID=G7JYC2_MEDTR|nr:Defensin fusion [Medicago truncatula]RHN55826.1 hypothetical protein MtrunA17_Chr5g0422651 [Medicago truncatula]